MKTINWGIIGPGKIAKKFATDLQRIPGANLYALASRSLEKAKAFAEEFPADKLFDDYLTMLEDKNLDVVYIATPHVKHCENTLACLDRGKAVLCEKAFAMNSQEVSRMIAKAKEKNVFLMEALWTLCLPHILKTQELIEEGVIGDVVGVKADFGFNAERDPSKRLFNRDLGGGSLLDIGIYPLFLSLFILGKPEKITAVATIGETQVDEECVVIMQYPGGKMANCHSTLLARTRTEAFIFGTKGYIHIPNRWHGPNEGLTILHYDDLQETFIPFDYDVLGLKYEAEEVMRCLRAGKKESDLVPHSFSLDLMAIMDEVRNQIGLVYPNHD